ncbi:TIGR03086 family protein [Nakamurella panacisegetis]|uniref:TIGR03086 family protein n=1 Tax=Nakamurella panacisegetis TaxID=1090615 RepID=A0A1H0N295_9ACTN|nr:TIGR03086 family protein [Nakamurella panacisegetis]
MRLHARAQALLDGVLSPPVDLERPSPCDGWRLRDLLAHMLGQNLGLRAAARGEGRDVESWRPVDPGDDPAAALAASERALEAAFAASGLAGDVWMPELSPAAPIPARTALLAHLLDSVVHGWDVAASLARPYEVPDDLLDVVATVTARIPAEPGRGQTGSAFRAPVRYRALSRLDSVLAHLGRDPRAWPLPAVARPVR